LLAANLQASNKPIGLFENIDGDKKLEHAPGLIVTTIATSAVTASSVNTGVTVAGVFAFTEKGVVYSTAANPTTANSKLISAGVSNGSYALSVTALTASTTYHVRAYAISGVTTYYGADVSFTTLALPVITAQPVGGAICGSGNIDLSVSATGSGTLNYQWKKDGNNTGANSNVLSASAAGIYSVLVSDNNGSIASGNAVVTVTAAPAAPVATDTVICTGTNAQLYATGTGTLGWYDAATGGNYLGAGNSYNTPALNTSTTYYVQDSSCTASPSRTAVVVTVNPPVTYYQDADGDGFGNAAVTTQSCNGIPTGYAADNTDCNDAIATVNPAVFGAGFWNVFAYNGSSYENYYGYYTDTHLDFNTDNYWNGAGSPSDAPGYTGCTVPPDGHSYKAKRKGFTPGCYIINIPSHDDNTTLYIDGIMVFQHNGCCDSHNNVWTGELNASSEVEIATQEGGGWSNAWYTFSTAASGTISASQAVCIASLPADITLSGGTGAIQWQSSADNLSFSDIIGATGATLPGTTIGAISSALYIRAVSAIGTCFDTSAVVTITVNTLPTAAISGVATGYDSVTLTASGGTSYLWSGGNTINSAINTMEKSLGYTVIVYNENGCADTANVVVHILRMALNRYGAVNDDSATHVNSNGAIGTGTSVDKNGKLRNGGINDGRSIATAGSSAYQIKHDFPASADGLYWIKNSNINGGLPFRIYADMTTDGGGWTLILCNKSPNTGWDNSTALLRNETHPDVNAVYSIIGWADYIKKSSSGFQYMIDAQSRGNYGGIWTANSNYSFVSTSNSNTNITLNTKFGSWDYNDGGIEERMPWYAPGSQGIITTSGDANGSWWGTLIAAGGWDPAPWLGCCGMPSPGIIWYWVR
jgi:hypothetical protein